MTPWMGDRPVATPVPAHGKTRTNIHALNGTHDPSIQAVNTHALDRATTVIGNLCSSPSIIMDDQVWENEMDCRLHLEIRNARKVLVGKPKG
jgi:hypothetical protein